MDQIGADNDIFLELSNSINAVLTRIEECDNCEIMKLHILAKRSPHFIPILSNESRFRNTDFDSTTNILHQAAFLGESDIFDALIKYGDAVDICNWLTWKNADGWTPFMVACACGNLDCLELILDFFNPKDVLTYASLNSPKNQHNALAVSIVLGQYEVSMRLLELGVNVNFLLERDINIFHILAASVGFTEDQDIELFWAIYNLNPSIDLEHFHENNLTCLQEAIRYNKFELFKLLLKENPNLANCHEESRSETALFLCCQRDFPIAREQSRVRFAKELILHGADVNQVSKLYLNTPLMTCLNFRNRGNTTLQVAKLLIDSGCDLFRLDRSKFQALTICVHNLYFHGLKLLLETGEYDVNTNYGFGNLFDYASKRYKVRLVQGNQAFLTTGTHNYFSSNFPILKLLLDHGAKSDFSFCYSNKPKIVSKIIHSSSKLEEYLLNVYTRGASKELFSKLGNLDLTLCFMTVALNRTFAFRTLLQNKQFDVVSRSIPKPYYIGDDIHSFSAFRFVEINCLSDFRLNFIRHFSLCYGLRCGYCGFKLLTKSILHREFVFAYTRKAVGISLSNSLVVCKHCSFLKADRGITPLQLAKRKLNKIMVEALNFARSEVFLTYPSCYHFILSQAKLDNLRFITKESLNRIGIAI